MTDSRLADPVRPIFLAFDGEVEPGEPFAHMVESGALTGALLDACRRERVQLETVGVSGFDRTSETVTTQLSDGRPLAATLLVAADGARSRLREAAGIGWVA